MPLSLLNHSALALFAQRTRIPASARSTGFCAIWVCISSSSIIQLYCSQDIMQLAECAPVLGWFDDAGNRTRNLSLFCWTAIKQTQNQLSQVRSWYGCTVFNLLIKVQFPSSLEQPSTGAHMDVQQ